MSEKKVALTERNVMKARWIARMKRRIKGPTAEKRGDEGGSEGVPGCAGVVIEGAVEWHRFDGLVGGWVWDAGHLGGVLIRQSSGCDLFHGLSR